ncbi:hypothetical protein K491DRAFT_590669 [Lophiostoma macrostomum CBS 122681]|uniref:Rhodopsin domain-containing protein n=1 Tax=Lophiostoma macrostomum CBS 122681 TaxID=1314788 RepID=A0A6A6TKZ7_9PLEO|nr:hypothetical protein K491DRAFT_590669 [Lophiostoma macrostomum CBS 122681]
MATEVSALTVESWTFFALGISLVVSRVILRIITLGSFSRLQLDDWIMIFTIVPFTGIIACANRSFSNWNTALGLKLRFALEEFQIITLWSVKACLLILYRRIFPSVLSKRQRQFLGWTAGYCLLTFLIVQVVFPLWCLPITSYFDPVSSNLQCTTYRNHNLVTWIFDLTTTLLIFILVIPFIRTPRKLLLSVLFLLGLIVLTTGIVSRYYILTTPKLPTYLPWYTAEASTSLVFANLPFLSSLVTSSPSNRTRRQRFSSVVSLPPWPRLAVQECSPNPRRFQRLDSTATTASTASRSATEHDFDDAWSDAGIQPSTPPTPIHTLRPTDPPLELEIFWSSRRPSTRDDVEKGPLDLR